MEVPQPTAPSSLPLTPHPSRSGPILQRVDSPASLSQTPAVPGSVFSVAWAGNSGLESTGTEGSGGHVFSAPQTSLSMRRAATVIGSERTLQSGTLEQVPDSRSTGCKAGVQMHVCLTHMLVLFLLLCVAKEKVYPRTTISTWKLIFETHCVFKLKSIKEHV